MPIFEYSATNVEGSTVRGTLHGADLQSAAEALKRQGLEVHELSATEIQMEQQPFQAPPTEARPAFATDFAGPLVGGAPLEALHFFFRQLGTMLKAGITPVQALDTLSRQTKSGKLKQVILEMRDHVRAGRPLSAGMARYPEVFSPLVLSLMKVAEEGGFVDEQASQISEYLQRDMELRNLIRRETFYPKAVIIASIVIILATNFIIRSLMVSGQGLSSPLTTLTVWMWLCPLIIGFFLFMKLVFPRPDFQTFWHRFTMALPWIGPMIHGFAMAKFGRALGSLYKGGVPVGRAVTLAAQATGSEKIRRDVEPAGPMIEDGHGITDSLASTGAFSPIVLDMTRTGEMTGNLDQMLTKMAEFYEDEGQTRAKQAGTIWGVICFLAVALYVGYVVISFYTGYFGGIMSNA